MDGLTDFFGTTGRKCYLLVKGDKAGGVDLRHHFAAATESDNSRQSGGKLGVKLGGSPGQAVSEDENWRRIHDEPMATTRRRGRALRASACQQRPDQGTARGPEVRRPDLLRDDHVL